MLRQAFNSTLHHKIKKVKFMFNIKFINFCQSYAILALIWDLELNSHRFVDFQSKF